MAGPRDQAERSPVFAGRFYPADPQRCRDAARELVAAADSRLAGTIADRVPAPASEAAEEPLWLGGIVPHAGWICSGAIAAETIAAIAARRPAVDVVVIFGAIHSPAAVDRALFDSHGLWVVPGSTLPVTADLRDELAGQSDLFSIDDRFHRYEHAVEVELPLVSLAWPEAAILPVETPPTRDSAEFGRRAARAIESAGLRAVYLASSDLTHYGEAYDFAPAGEGIGGLEWAKDNDRRLLDVVMSMQADAVVPQAMEHHSACGPGAIAAMLAACQWAGAKHARVLRHANSFETLAAVAPQPPDNAVGYASVVVGE